MQQIANYEIISVLYEGPNSLLYRAKNNKDQGEQKVILKILWKEFPSPEEIARFKREFEMTRSVKDAGIIQVYHFFKHQNSYGMAIEDFGGDSIANFLLTNQFTIAQFLPVAISIAESLGKVHEKRIIHKDINPANIVWNPETNQVKLIDFGISSELSQETTSLQSLNKLEGTLSYMSPEQTGRMNRALDYRTDLYSLGATFYNMLTGQAPFSSQDAMEIVHGHIAKEPISPHRINKEVPEILSKIILRLMAKTAENRYQSAIGLARDLQECWKQLRETGTIETFQIGAKDFSDRFEIPQKLYGRENEVENLMQAFERINPNTKELVFISGYSGIGKSTVVQEIYKPIVARKGIFIRGKFDQFKRNIPYYSLIQAFQALIQQILAEDKEELAVRKNEILNALGQNCSVIIDVIPNLELIVGKQSSSLVLSAEESKNRFNLIFRNFVRALTSGKNPLVLFLDDLQWADLPSLNLLEVIATDPEIGNLLIIGAYRDIEVSSTHLLFLTLEKIKTKDVTISNILLEPLTLYHISQIISDTLLVPQTESNTLASLCYEKTQGNPFFLNQFLQMLNKEKFIQFTLTEQKWVWNLEEIRKRQITENVVDIMIQKIKKLPDVTQSILKLAACIGNQFDLRTLATVNEKSLSNTSLDLWDALIEGLIIPTSNSYNSFSPSGDDETQGNIIEISILDSIIPEYMFLHDKVQQAAYSLIQDNEKALIHLKIARLLLEKNKKNQREDDLFDIVNHFNQGKELLSDDLEREKLINLNLLVSKKAKLSAAYEPAHNYAKNSLSLLGKDSWEVKFNLTFDIYLEAAETAYLSGNFETMEKLLRVVLTHNISLTATVQVFKIRILACIAQHDSLGAIKFALELLKLLEIDLPEQPSQEEIGKRLGDTMQSLSNIQTDDLLTLPVMNDKEIISAMEIMEMIYSACFQVNPGLFPILVFKMIQLSLKNGNTNTSSIAYSCYGLILCGIVGDINSGYQFGQLALKLMNKLQSSELKGNILYVVTIFLQHWKEPVRNTLTPFLEAYQVAMTVGDFEYGCWSAMYHNVHSYFAGTELTKLIPDTVKFRKAIQETNQETAFIQISMFLQVLLNLSSNSTAPYKLQGEIYNEEKMLSIHQKANDNTALCFIYFHKLFLFYLMEENEQALENSEMTAQYIPALPSTMYVLLFHFYDSLTRLALYPQKSNEEKEAILAKINENQTKMKNWADHCAENCLHKFYLVEAEKSRILGEDLQAIDFYDKAAKLAKENEFLQEEAIANELFARFWLSRDKEELAQLFFNKAYHLYLLWGAGAKVAQLEKKYGHLLSKRGKINKKGTIHATTTLSSLDDKASTLDLVSVMKASQSISQEIVIEGLLKNMMHIVIENAGAQTGFFLQEKNNAWVIEAQGEEKLNANIISNSSTHQVPMSIIQYVSRTKEPVVLDNASKDNRYISDPYIIQNQPNSILCSAILHHGKILGILYLENNSLSGVFTKERLEVLQLLSSQFAISLENANLYANLEEKVSERTAQLEIAHKTILQLEKDNTEKQLAGGFAHEMRNALVGPKLVIQHALGQDGQEPYESLSLINSRKLKEIYLLIKGKVSEEVLQDALKAMKVVFDNEEQIDNSLKIIQNAVSKGLSITQLIMEYSKIGNEKAGHDNIDLNILLKNTLNEFQTDLSNSGVILHLDLTNEISNILGLETHFESVFQNLIINAKDALLDKTFNGKKEKVLEVKTSIESNIFNIEFKDNGVGISKENLNRIYDAFYSTKPDTGTGLGLGVVKKIVTLYNGSIEVQSEIGVETKFNILFPIQR